MAPPPVFAADLHLHSRHAAGVSPAMTLEAIATTARLKGIDVIGTGDCLQPSWLDELESKLLEAEPGWFALRPEVESALPDPRPPADRPTLRFVLSTELHAAPPGTPKLGGIHYLVYFRSFASARRMRRRLAPHGDLRDGRPRLALDSRRLLQGILNHDDPCEFALAHVWNPYFAAFGSQSGAATLETLFGDLAPRVELAETGLTANPAMCRRFSPLDGCALFSCSDAHSLDNIGREFTRVATAPGFDPLFAALRGHGPGRILDTIKFPLELNRHYRNWCGRCRVTDPGHTCPRCGQPLIPGAHDRWTALSDRATPVARPDDAPFHALLPLRLLIASLCGCGPHHRGVTTLLEKLLRVFGHERHVLTLATEEEIAAATTRQLARGICAQRTADPGRATTAPTQTSDAQLDFSLG